jgi:hypothetical protein
VYALKPTGSKDPADLIRENPEAWKESIGKKRHIIEVMLVSVLDTEKDSRAQGRRIVAEVLPYVRAVQSPIDRAHFVKLISEKTGIPSATLMEELSRGATAQPEQTAPPVIALMKSKERFTRELIAYATLHDKRADEEFIALALDTTQFPEAIIQEEMFKLEERLIGDKEAYFKDLIKSYKRELNKEEFAELQEQLRGEGADTEALMKRLSELAKRGQ